MVRNQPAFIDAALRVEMLERNGVPAGGNPATF